MLESLHWRQLLTHCERASDKPWLAMDLHRRLYLRYSPHHSPNYFCLLLPVEEEEGREWQVHRVGAENVC